MAVLVLEALAVERGAAGGRAHQEPAGAAVGRGPDQVADPLEAEHRVVDVERDRVHAVRAVRGAGGDEVGHAPGLVDPLLEDLPGGRLPVLGQRPLVDRVVELADGGVDAERVVHRRHAERLALVRDDRDDELADVRVLHQPPHQRDPGQGRGLALPGRGALQGAGERFRLGRVAGHRLRVPGRLEPAEGLAPLEQVAHLRGVVGRAVGTCTSPGRRRRRAARTGRGTVRSPFNSWAPLQLLGLGLDQGPLLGGQRHLDLLLLVGRVARLGRRAVALDRLDQDDARRPAVVEGGPVGVVHLDRVVPAAAQGRELLVRLVLRPAPSAPAC